MRVNANVTRTGVGDEVHEPPMAAGVTGTVTTGTGATTGTITMAAGHGLVDGDIVAVFFTSAAGVPSVIYGLLVDMTGDVMSVALDAGEYNGVSPAGAVLPAASTPVVVSKKTVSTVSADKDDITAILVGCDQPAIGIFGGAAEIYPVHIAVGASPISWDAAAGSACPIDDDPTALVCYNGSAVAVNFQYGFLLAT